jgi:benzodiazapine receptor
MQSHTLRNGTALAMLGGATAAAATLGPRVVPRSPIAVLFRAPRGPLARFRPSASVLAPTWTVLRTMVAVSGYRTRHAQAGPERERAMQWWTVQQSFRGAKSPRYFGRRNARAALLDSALLLASAGSYARYARQVDEGALLLIAPYLGWLTFATLLNVARVRHSCS